MEIHKKFANKQLKKNDLVYRSDLLPASVNRCKELSLANILLICKSRGQISLEKWFLYHEFS